MSEKPSGKLSEIDRRFLGAAIRLGRSRVGMTAPNPSVGAILVQFEEEGPRVVGRGVTGDGGRPHGEVHALTQAGALAKGATCYVSLEPCSHYGKTPPCCEALDKAGVKRVVIGLIDPDPRVRGQGVAMLEAAGIEVVVADMPEARLAHRGFISRLEENRPWITLKLAVSADGMIGRRGEPNVPITSERTRQVVHSLRARHDAIAVGAETARLDKPKLNCRLEGMEEWSPRKVVLGGHSNVLEGAEHFPSSDAEQVDLKAAFSGLAKDGITRVFVEGGAQIARSLISEKLVDELILFSSSKTIGENGVPAFAGLELEEVLSRASLNPVRTLKLGDDRCDVFRRVDVAGGAICSQA